MRRLLAFVLALTVAAPLVAQPRQTFDYSAIAKRLVQQLALKPGERVLSVAHPGIFEDLLPYIRYEVMRAGGVDLGGVDVLREPVPDTLKDDLSAHRGRRRIHFHWVENGSAYPIAGRWTA